VHSVANYCPKCGAQLPVQESQPTGQQQYQPQYQQQYQMPYQQGYSTQHPRKTRPEGAIVLSMIAGVFIMINGLIVAILGAFMTFMFMPAGIVVLIAGLILGLVVFIAAIKLSQNPEEHITWGVLILVFSLLSIVIGGGFIIGMILGFIGGLLAIVWNA
jgi:hypothetical protein